MRNLSIFVTLMALAAPAFALDGSDKAAAWAKASAGERLTYVSQYFEITGVASRAATRVEISNCLDAVIGSSARSAVATMTLAEAASSCLARTRNR